MPGDLLKGTAFEGWDPFAMVGEIYMGFVEGEVEKDKLYKKAQEMALETKQEEKDNEETALAFQLF
jgi:hypothetical protein